MPEIDPGLFAVICIGFLAALFIAGVIGWCMAAKRADQLAFDDERAYLDALAKVSRTRPRRGRFVAPRDSASPGSAVRR